MGAMGKVDIDAIKAANPLHEVVERFTGQRIERHKIYAPWRQESTPSVHIYDDGTWYDYGAGKGGDVIDFVGYCLHGESYDFHTVIDTLGALDIKPLPRTTTKEAPKKPANKLGITLDDIERYNVNMPAQRRAYWHGRGLTDQTINEFYLGWDGQRYTIPALYRFQLFGLKRRQSEIDDGIPAKYTQAVGSRVGIFNADMLWDAESVIICEGEIDCMLLHQAGFVAVSSTGGAGSWKAEWTKFFTHVQRIHILYDNDKAGIDGARKIQRDLRRAQVVTLPEDVKDVGELFEKLGDPVGWLQGKTE
jgi:DNA primase